MTFTCLRWEWTLRAVTAAFALLLIASPASARDEAFQQWIQGVAQEAVAGGVAPAVVYKALSQVDLDEDVVELDQKQPEKTIDFETYSEKILSQDRIEKGRELVAQHGSLLRKLYTRYGVPPHMIVALWAMESSFGNNQGSYNVVDSLATLAYEGRRADFFRRELINALRILDQEGIEVDGLRGSWAGAMGQCQFMPSTYLNYAVDYDGDGSRDIWDNESDALASIANYLAAEGWKAGKVWGNEVDLSRDLPEKEIGLGVKHTLAEWKKRGVRRLNGKPLPVKPLTASLIQPDGAGGRSFLVYDNFRAIMKWNRSTYFATTVGLLADRIKGTKAQ